MRTRTGILITTGALLGAMAVFLLLFWFAFPRWWPEVVIRHSPSLRHVLETAANEPEDFIRIRLPDLSRFEARYGDDLYAAIVACEDGSNPRMRFLIMRYFMLYEQNPVANRVFREFFPPDR